MVKVYELLCYGMKPPEMIFKTSGVRYIEHYHSFVVLTRELLYTAVTRASDRVTLVGDEAVIRHAINRSVERASGLGVRLWGSGWAVSQR